MTCLEIGCQVRGQRRSNRHIFTGIEHIGAGDGGSNITVLV